MKKIEFPKPKYQFGDRLHHGELHKGIVYGMEYRDNLMARKAGWWYMMRWDKRDSLQGVHELSLRPSCPNCGEKWDKGCDNCGLSVSDISSN